MIWTPNWDGIIREVFNWPLYYSLLVPTIGGQQYMDNFLVVRAFRGYSFCMTVGNILLEFFGFNHQCVFSFFIVGDASTQ